MSSPNSSQVTGLVTILALKKHQNKVIPLHCMKRCHGCQVELRPGAAFLCYLPFPINSQCSSLIVKDIRWVLLSLIVYITQRCPATCLVPITRDGIEIIILLNLADLIIPCCHAFWIHAGSLSLQRNLCLHPHRCWMMLEGAFGQPGGDTQGLVLQLGANLLPSAQACCRQMDGMKVVGKR